MSAKAAAQVDVIVVRGGGSGLAAAIEARMLGRSVILLAVTPIEIRAGLLNMRGGGARSAPSPHAQTEHVS